jgi:pimeloyl-ACP methyl ester carboxylesterase
MGGVVATQVAAHPPDRFARLIYSAAFVPREGQSLIDLTRLPEGRGDQTQANLVVEGDPPMAYVPGEVARRTTFACRRDQSIPPALQRLMLEAAGCTDVVELDTDHVPQLSATAELAAILLERAR